jgi:hypothetical protein
MRPTSSEMRGTTATSAWYWRASSFSTREGSTARNAAGNRVPSVIGTSPKITPGTRQPTCCSTPSVILVASIFPETTANSARSSSSCTAYSPGGQADVGRLAREVAKVVVAQRREERDRAELVEGQHRAPIVRRRRVGTFGRGRQRAAGDRRARNAFIMPPSPNPVSALRLAVLLAVALASLDASASACPPQPFTAPSDVRLRGDTVLIVTPRHRVPRRALRDQARRRRGGALREGASHPGRLPAGRRRARSLFRRRSARRITASARPTARCASTSRRRT